MADRIPVFVYASDPVSQAGVATQVRGRAEVCVVEDGGVDNAVVALVVSAEVDGETVRIMTAIQRNGCPKVLLVVSRLDDAGMLSAVEAGVGGLVRRCESTPERLAGAIMSVAGGEGTMPPDMLGRL